MFTALPPGSGTGIYKVGRKIAIKLLRQGCTNRPFYHVVVAESRYDKKMPVIEQLGTYDPLPNEHNEKLVALNYERIRYWLGNGAHLSRSAEQLLGLSGLLPIHPINYMQAWRARKAQREEQSKKDSSENGKNG